MKIFLKTNTGMGDGAGVGRGQGLLLGQQTVGRQAGGSGGTAMAGSTGRDKTWPDGTGVIT